MLQTTLFEGIPQYITLSEKITKTRRGGKNDQRDLPGRIHLDPEMPNLCPVRTILLYQSKKTDVQKAPDKEFFLTVKRSAEKDPNKEMYWYLNHPMGINMIGGLFTAAIEKSGLDIGNRRISATSARKNLAQVGASAAVPSPLLSRFLGQRNLDSKVHYVKNTQDIEKAASILIARGVQGHDTDNFTSMYNDVKSTQNCGENAQSEPSEAVDSPVTSYEPVHVSPSQHIDQPGSSHNYVNQQYNQPGSSHNYGHPHYYQPEPYYPPPPSHSHGSYGYQEPYHPPQPHYYPPQPHYYPPPQPHYYSQPQSHYYPPPQPHYYPPAQPQYYPPSSYDGRSPNNYSLTQNNNYTYNGNNDRNQASITEIKQTASNDNGKRVLTDISNFTKPEFSFKKPKVYEN